MKRLALIFSLLFSGSILFHLQAGDKGDGAPDLFEALRPMYVVTGVPVNGQKVDRNNADVKFQLSFAIPLWRSMGHIDGLNLKIAYTQRSVWYLYGESSPFKDNMYMPAIMLDVPLKLEGSTLMCGIEHRSNGRSDSYSRSVNYIFGEYTHRFGFGLTLSANARFGTGWYDDTTTQAIFYRFWGYCNFGALYEIGRFSAMVNLTPVFAPFKVSTTAELSFRLAKAATCPFHLFAQFHYGYDECLCDCVYDYDPAPYIRMGVLITLRGVHRLSM